MPALDGAGNLLGFYYKNAEQLDDHSFIDRILFNPKQMQDLHHHYQAEVRDIKANFLSNPGDEKQDQYVLRLHTPQDFQELQNMKLKCFRQLPIVTEDIIVTTGHV
mmetsp:Transcript_21382/g.27762  ORF Transcript_21382/g.27762 Transcript_21382/m.27762 type:complete len:106 (+) Transcript_21382:1-318(+)